MIDMFELDIAIQMNDPTRFIEGCRCDLSVGRKCELCYTDGVLRSCKREIESFQKKLLAVEQERDEAQQVSREILTHVSGPGYAEHAKFRIPWLAEPQ
jgi:hypothetical protein